MLARIRRWLRKEAPGFAGHVPPRPIPAPAPRGWTPNRPLPAVPGYESEFVSTTPVQPPPRDLSAETPPDHILDDERLVDLARLSAVSASRPMLLEAAPDPLFVELRDELRATNLLLKQLVDQLHLASAVPR